MKTLSKHHIEAIEKAKTEQGKVKAAALAMIETPMDLIKAVLLKREEVVIETMRELHQQQQADEALLRQALEAMEILRNGLIQMREHAESYGEAWSRAYIKEYRDLLPGSAEEHLRALNAMQHRLADVADGVVKGFDAIAALRERLEETGTGIFQHQTEKDT